MTARIADRDSDWALGRMRVELIDEPLPQPFARGSGALSSKRQMFRSANDPTFLREMLEAIELEDQIEAS